MEANDESVCNGIGNMKIFVNMNEGATRDSFIKPRTWERLRTIAHVGYNNTVETLELPDLAIRLRDADALVTGWGQKLITPDILGNVKIIAHTGGTVNGIIDESVFNAGIKVLSGNNYYAESVAEGVLGYMLFMLRKMDHYSGKLKNRLWEPGYNEGLYDQTVGIVSLGAISRHLIKLLKPFRVKIKVYSTTQNPETSAELGFTYAGLEEIFETCKIVSVHTARKPETEKMINARHFALLRDDAIFINTSRGAVIDENALIEELKTGRFRALLDVYTEEPLPLNSALYALENVALFPHMAGPTVDRRDYITNFLIDDIERFFRGDLLENEITWEVANRMTK
jgi:phosphoglycerate dehydrogenase-like enzyme